MKNKTFLIILSGLVIMALIIFSVIKWKVQEEPTNQITIRIPDTKFMGLLPLYVAEEKGFFEKYNIRIKWIDVKDPGQAEKAFLAGHADLNITTFASSLQAEIRQPGTLAY